LRRPSSKSCSAALSVHATTPPCAADSLPRLWAERRSRGSATRFLPPGCACAPCSSSDCRRKS
jgi:hypothetical protein